MPRLPRFCKRFATALIGIAASSGILEACDTATGAESSSGGAGSGGVQATTAGTAGNAGASAGENACDWKLPSGCSLIGGCDVQKPSEAPIMPIATCTPAPDCTFTFDQDPGIIDGIGLLIDCEPVTGSSPRFQYEPDARTLVLLGEACDAVRSRPNSQITFVAAAFCVL